MRLLRNGKCTAFCVHRGSWLLWFLRITCIWLKPVPAIAQNVPLKVWMWYLSVTLLVVMVTFLTIRCLLFFFAWIAGYEFWVLPRLFDESLAFAESFTPVSSGAMVAV